MFRLGGDSDVELMDESDDEEPTVIVAVVRSEQEAEISVPSENVINIHDHGDNQSVVSLLFLEFEYSCDEIHVSLVVLNCVTVFVTVVSSYKMNPLIFREMLLCFWSFFCIALTE